MIAPAGQICYDDSENISHEDLLTELGITEEELADVDVEIE